MAFICQAENTAKLEDVKRNASKISSVRKKLHEENGLVLVCFFLKKHRLQEKFVERFRINCLTKYMNLNYL